MVWELPRPFQLGPRPSRQDKTHVTVGKALIYSGGVRGWGWGAISADPQKSGFQRTGLHSNHLKLKNKEGKIGHHLTQKMNSQATQ